MFGWDVAYELDVVPLVTFNGRVFVFVFPSVGTMLWSEFDLGQLLVHHVVIDLIEVLDLIRLKSELVPSDKAHLNVCYQHHVLTDE